LILPIEVETGWDDMPVFTYAPDMAYGEDGQRLPNAFSAAELGLHAELFLNLFQSYEMFNTLSAQGNECTAIEAHYRGLKALVLSAVVRVIKARKEALVVEQVVAACRFMEQAEEAAEAQKAEEEAQEAYWAAQAVAWETNAEGDWANRAQEAVWAAEFEAAEAAEAEEPDDKHVWAYWAAEAAAYQAEVARVEAEGVWDDETQKAPKAAKAPKAEEPDDKHFWDYWEAEAAAYKAEVEKVSAEGVCDEETEEDYWSAQYSREEARSARIAAQMAEISMDYWEHSRTWYD